MRTFEFVARVSVPIAQIRRTVIGQRVALEPCPQIFDLVQVGRIRWQRPIGYDRSIRLDMVEAFF